MNSSFDREHIFETRSSSKLLRLRLPNNNTKKELAHADHVKSGNSDEIKMSPDPKKLKATCETEKGLVGEICSEYGTWEKMYEQLLRFQEVHGHCRVPNRYDENRQLGAWVATQRRNYKLMKSGRRKKTSLTKEREVMLAGIGFEWSVEKSPWDARFTELLEFVAMNGHALVPTKWKQNSQLAWWVSCQRREYKNLQEGRASSLDQGQIKLLNNIGFVWEAQKGGSKRIHDGSLVPTSNSTVAKAVSPHLQLTANKMMHALNVRQTSLAASSTSVAINESRNSSEADIDLGLMVRAKQEIMDAMASNRAIEILSLAGNSTQFSSSSNVDCRNPFRNYVRLQQNYQTYLHQRLSPPPNTGVNLLAMGVFLQTDISSQTGIHSAARSLPILSQLNSVPRRAMADPTNSCRGLNLPDFYQSLSTNRVPGQAMDASNISSDESFGAADILGRKRHRIG